MRFLFLITIVSVGLFGKGTWHTSAGEPPVGEDDFLANVLPADTLAFFRFKNWSRLREQAETLPMGKLYMSSVMDAFRKEMNEKGGGYLIDTFGIDIQHVDEFAAGEFVIAGLPSKSKVMSIVTILEVGSDAAAEKFVQSMAPRLESRGIRSKSSPPGMPPSAKVFELNQRVGDVLSGGPLILCPIGTHVVVGREFEIFRSLVKRWNDKDRDNGLGQSPNFQSVMGGLVPETPHLFEYYIDPIAWAVVSDKLAYDGSDISLVPEAWRDDSGGRIPFPQRHGFAGLNAIAGAGWQSKQTQKLEFDIVIHAPPERTGAMKMFDFVGGELKFPKWIPDGAKVATLVRWNLSSILPSIGELFDDITNASGAFDATMGDLKRELKVDLPGELMPSLGPELAFMSGYDDKRALDSTVIAIKIQNPAKNERKVARMIYQLLAGDTETRRTRLPGKRYELWQVKLMVPDGKSSFSQAGLMVADGQLWISTHATALRRAVLQSKKSPLQNSSLDKEFRKVLRSHVTANSFGLTLSRMDLDSKYAYEALRIRGPKGLKDVESIYSTLLQIFIDEENSVVDFSKLPAFDEIKENLHNLAILADITEEGWRAKGLVFEGPK